MLASCTAVRCKMQGRLCHKYQRCRQMGACWGWICSCDFAHSILLYASKIKINIKIKIPDLRGAGSILKNLIPRFELLAHFLSSPNLTQPHIPNILTQPHPTMLKLSLLFISPHETSPDIYEKHCPISLHLTKHQPISTNNIKTLPSSSNFPSLS